MFYRIRELREYEDYSMSYVAKKLKVAKSTYSMWEYCIDTIPLIHLLHLANLYHTNLDYLLNLSDNKEPCNFQTDIDKMIVAKNLLKKRKFLKLTQQKVANDVTMPRTTYASYEQGKVLITTLYLYAYCKTYNVSADEIISDPKLFVRLYN